MIITAPTVAFVIPCYNEEAGLRHTLDRLLASGKVVALAPFP
jgi:glycosyltransferase involved in cell wall biosynthesis